MALGLVLIYKTADVVNFGHGDMAAFSLIRAFAAAVLEGFTSLLGASSVGCCWAF